MELFRVSRNAWGQETLLGLSWDLVWVFVGAAALFIAVHALYKWRLAPGAGALGAGDGRNDPDRED